MGKNKNSVQQQQKDKGGKQDKLGGGKEASGVQLHYSSYIQVCAVLFSLGYGIAGRDT